METAVVVVENDGIVSVSLLSETVHDSKNETHASLAQKISDEHESDQLMKSTREEAHGDLKKIDTSDETITRTTETTTDLVGTETRVLLLRKSERGSTILSHHDGATDQLS
jgi:hypothetical protein